MTTMKHLTAIPAGALRIQLRQPNVIGRCMSSTKGPNLPDNDNAKSLSTRDNRIFAQVKKLRSSILNEPPVLTKGFHPTAITNRGVYLGSTFLEYPPQPLPQLHAQAFLDPKAYCKISASASNTISGADAARRLIRGKRNLMETMRSEIHEKKEEVRKLYVLRGHGVPVQLLKHHLQMARAWLTQQDHVNEVSVQNVFGTMHFDRMLVRTHDGATHISVWPRKWDHNMELYLTVMKRLANQLSSILYPQDGGQSQPPRLKQWNVIVQAAGPYSYGAAVLPPQLIPSDASERADGEASTAVLVVEVVPMEGSTGRVSIRLQSHSSSSSSALHDAEEEQNGEVPAAMVFEGIFDTKQEIGQTTASR